MISPATATLDDDIRAKVNAFATDLSVLVRRAALEAVSSALGAVPSATPGEAPRKGRGRPKKTATPAAAPARAPSAVAKPAKPARRQKASGAKKATTAKRGPGEKRPPAELSKLIDKLGEHIKAHPGQRMEAISKALGTSTKELTLPVRKLLAAKKVRAEGEKRATKYFSA